MIYFVRPSLARKPQHVLNMTSRKARRVTVQPVHTELNVGEFLNKSFCVYLHLSYASMLLFQFSSPLELFLMLS